MFVSAPRVPAAPAPWIETPRLILRPPVAEDLDAWAAFAADAETMRFIGGPGDRARAWRSIATMAGSWALHGFGMFSVIERATGRWVGRIGPWRPEGWPGTEVGWGLSREVWGRGYATEAAAAAMDYAVDVLGWTEIIHCIDPENHGSARVAAALGSVRGRTGVLLPGMGEVPPVDIWGQTAAAWRARRG